MPIHTLPKIVMPKKRRVGLGTGSGRGKTAGRGTKGQKARGKVKLGFEGGQLPFIRRFPYRKGFKSFQKKTLPINVSKLNIFKDGEEVNDATLRENKLISQNTTREVKILSDGKLEKKLTVKGIACSEGAKKKIEAAGGTVSET